MSLSTLARPPRKAAPFNVERAPGGGGNADPGDRFDALTRYIPTETITIFVAAAGAIGAIQDVWPGVSAWALYIGCAVLTPLIFWAVAYGRHHQANDAKPFTFAVWEPVAATIAFLVWALSVPPLLSTPSQHTLAAVGAVLVSALLSLLEPIFSPPPLT